MANKNKRTIVYFSSIPWNFSWHRQQEMMSMLADMGYTIIFVQPHNKKNWKGSQPKKIRDNIWVISPPGLPFERLFRVINFINGIISQICVSSILKLIKDTNPIIWFDRVHGCNPSIYLKKYACVYDLIDEILAFGRFRNNKMLICLENNVLKKCSLLVSSSKLLLERKQEQANIADKGMFIPNGVNICRFELLKESVSLHSHTITVGFIGTISDRSINFELVKKCAELKPEWKFVFVGPCSSENKLNLTSKNIILSPPVPGNKIPDIIKDFTVGFIPYNYQKRDMDYVFPRKALEFLAAGIPVIATPMPELKGFAPYIRCSGTPEGVIESINAALHEYKPIENRHFAEQFDWNVLLKNLRNELSML